MARTVADAAALLTALAGVDPADEATAAAEGKIEDYTKSLDPNGLRGMRLGVMRKYAGFSLSVDKLFADALKVMKQAGAEIIDPVEIATYGKWDSLEQTVLLYEFKADLNNYLATLGPGAKVQSLADVIAFNNAHTEEEMKFFGQELLLQAQEKGGLDTEEYTKALADCRRLTRDEGIDATMDKHKLDAIICPTGTPAWLIDLINGDANEPSSSSLAAVAGYPHITVPMGEVFGLPVGISFFGRAWSESVLIKAAYAYEQQTKHRRPPQLLQSANLHV
jgi:amidase